MVLLSFSLCSINLVTMWWWNFLTDLLYCLSELLWYSSLVTSVIYLSSNARRVISWSGAGHPPSPGGPMGPGCPRRPGGPWLPGAPLNPLYPLGPLLPTGDDYIELENIECIIIYPFFPFAQVFLLVQAVLVDPYHLSPQGHLYIQLPHVVPFHLVYQEYNVLD